MNKNIFLLLIPFLILSCAAQAKGKSGKNSEPEWVQNPKNLYPDQMYLTAIGEGDSRSEAENYAAANLARIFQVKVTTDETYRQRYQELTRAGTTEFQDFTDVSKNVNLQAEETLYNIQFAESFTDKMGRVKVLAYLNRWQTAELYEERINTNSSKIADFLEMAASAQDTMIRYAALSAAVAVSSDSEVLLRQLDIISPTTKEFLEINYNHQQISRELAEQASRISFRLNIENDSENKISILLIEMLTSLGFVMSEPALLTTQGVINFEETDLNRDDFQFIRYDFQVKILDDAGKTIAALSEKGKEGHTTYFEARERAVRKIGEKIRTSFKPMLISYFDNLVVK